MRILIRFNFPEKGFEHSSHGGGGGEHFVTQHYDNKGSFKEMSLRDLFDIALTTLAFLSFGMFLLQVLMCVTMVCICLKKKN